jgi:glutamate-1-semialdehyde 2,1-aminomutase
MARIVADLGQAYQEALAGSARLYEHASEIFPSGVTHDARFLRPFPVYVVRAQGSRKWDVDGREYVDFWMGHGSLLLGHGHPTLVEAVVKQVSQGTHYGACHELEIKWGEWVKRLVPSAERVRFTSSGTEATMMAIRLARAFSGRTKVLKFSGHFHGWHDNVILDHAQPFDQPFPAGVLPAVADSVHQCPPNDIDSVEDTLKRDDDIACVIIEPTGGMFGVVPNRDGFLQELREVTRRYDVLLIFDEVVTGFRCAPGGAQACFGVRPDLTTLAKILSGGLPGGCVAGRKDVMKLLTFQGEAEWDTSRKMQHMGTFNANPLSAAAGIAMLQAIADGKAIAEANRVAETLRNRLNEVIASHRVNWAVYGDFSRICVLPDCDDSDDTVQVIQQGRYDHWKLTAKHPTLNGPFQQALLLEGVDLFGWAGMTSSAHTDEDIEHTVEAFDRAIHRVKGEGLVKPRD